MEVTLERIYNELLNIRRLLVKENEVKEVWGTAKDVTQMTGRDREWLRKMRNNHPNCYKKVRGTIKSIRYNMQFFEQFRATEE